MNTLIALIFISIVCVGLLLLARLLIKSIGDIFSPSKKTNTKHVCTQCGKVADPIKILRGSPVIELFLYLFFLIPGLFYSFWRSNGPTTGCKDCQKDTMISVDSPMGRKLTEQAPALIK